ncbi:MAG: excinuclease ABC subunit UvrA [Candidatus Poribacteria bacterium]|nr:excinuclease ABC subunit UvrA [Candidatus Poribacteria bacterium]
MLDEFIDIRGAREHNLRNIDLKLPKDRLIIFTGVSGSGKSSLAFDTIYAEGQRRYIESLSAYARQFLGQLEKPNVDFIGGLSPSISIDQKSTGHNPRSTVATITEIYDYLRVLFARVGTPHCLQCGRPVGAQTAEAIIDQIVNLLERTRILILAPIVSGRRGEYREDLEDALKAGFIRARIDGQVYDLADEIQLDRNQRHHIELVVDRIIIKPDIRSRVSEAVETALRMGDGRLIVNIVEGQPNAGDLLYSKDYTCVHCNISYEPPAPRQFSFNSPAGMCPTCKGLGTKTEMSVELVVPDATRSIREGAIVFWGKLETLNTRHLAESLAEHFGFSLDAPWEQLTDEQQQIILYGSGKEKIPFVYRSRRNRRFKYQMAFEGVIPPEERKYFQATSEMYKRHLSRYMVSGICPDCNGTRLKPEVKAVVIAGKSILDVVEMTVGECFKFFGKLQLPEREAFIATELLKEIKGRLWFLMNVGLHYLTLNRTAPTLSGGESQRIRLASQIGAGLRGVIYVLDEPSIGLHHRDNAHLLTTLKHLRDQGNTVIVVEHDEDTMRTGDVIVDFGPGPGVKGGEIVAIGPPQEVAQHATSLTAQYLRGEQRIEIPGERRPIGNRWLEICGARHHNLKAIDVRIPIGVFTGVTGVSGSGKSSLINDILYQALARDLMKAHAQPGEHDEIRLVIEGDENEEQNKRTRGQGGEQIKNTVVGSQSSIFNLQSSIDKVIDIDQTPIGRTPRSNPATYTKVFDHIRALYAEMPESKLRGYKQGRFSFNVKGGRCEACNGNGAKRIEMHFLADVWVKCNVCQGKRYNDETLQVKYRAASIADVLDMDVQEALEHFANVPTIAKILQTLHDVGLDYIKLGQPAPTLSGGEAQRIKLARELAKRSTGKTLYILDEPTTGLHFDDVKKLLEVLHQLVDAGNTVVVIEHNLEVVKTVDYLIDLGPEGGEEGGYVVAVGTPEEVAAVKESYTGQALKPVLDGRMEESSSDDTPYAIRHTQQTVREAGTDYQLDSNDTSPRNPEYISVRDAHEHNLKHINVDIPHRKLTTFTGVSGSGKSSLALDTIYAEGQRRYIESLSAYARQFLGQLEKPKVEKIEGLSPAIAIEQKAPSKNPRSTSGTVTEIYDYLRVLYARVGLPHCPQCGAAIGAQSVQQIVDKIMMLSDESRLYVLSPLNLRSNEDYPDAFRRLQRDGYVRVEVDGEIYPMDGAPKIGKSIKHDVKIVVDRLVLQPDERGRLTEAVETATRESGGTVAVSVVKGNRNKANSLFFSEHFACVPCGLSFPELTPRHFSFNSPLGQCKRCEGIGVTFSGKLLCKECNGTRIQPLARGVTLSEKTIAEVTAMSIGDARHFFHHLDLPAHQMEIGRELLKEIQNRLQFLVDIGLHYLTLNRPAPTLSGGEMQRIRLASQLGSGLTGVTYILDEPSIGLHQRDHERLLGALKRLRDLGNSVLVVEHDLQTILASDHILDFGPSAGKLGGEIVASGSPTEIQENEKSLTGGYLTGTLKIETPTKRRDGKGEYIEIIGARTNNLKAIDVEIPLGTLTCVTGVSGSGKSSLVEETLYPVLASNLNRTRLSTGKYRMIRGLDNLDKVINIDQQPIGDTPRSNPATYTDLFTKIRYLFADLPDAKVRGFDSRRFSFNQKTGQCETCRGHGYNKIEMHFLADVWVKCETCGGTGYNHETLQIRYKGKNVAEILEMTVQEALEHFHSVPSIRRPLQMLYDVGLDYIELGQAATTLSGGEAQRVKLARELSKRSTGQTIYIMDEPTTGLHFADVQKLLMVLNRLVDKGNTIVVIEHNMDVIKSADWVIDLGPEGGDEGGQIVAMGTPEEVAAVEQSHTGRFLRKALGA